MEPFGSQCFVCDAGTDRPPERPWEWSSPRMLCRAHDRVVQLPGDGTLLADALTRVSPDTGPVEGSLLGWVFNPVLVTVDGAPPVRAWTDFAAGGMAVLEDRFGAATFFEYWALNVPRALDALYALHLAASVPTPAPTPVAGGITLNIAFVYTAFQQVLPEGPEFTNRMNDGLTHLVLHWNSQARLDELRAAAGRPWPESRQELEEWVGACGPWMEPDARVLPDKSFFPTVLALAARRFGAPAPR